MATRPAKRRRLTPPPSEDEGTSRSSNRSQRQFLENAANWDLEQHYETKARKAKRKEKESTRLPIKLSGGRIQHVPAPAANDDGDGERDEDWLEGEEHEDGSETGPRDDVLAPHEPEIPEHEQILQAKEELARIAQMLNENPEENVGTFKALAKIGQSRIPAIQKLTLATQLTVYKDVIPGYRIRPLSEDAQQAKLSKDVRRLRGYEQALVSGYQAYVQDLARYAKSRGDERQKEKGQGIASIAIMCACTLLTAVPHFNFRGELLKILVGKLSTRKVDADFHKCLHAIQTLFQEDEEGRPSMDAVSLLSKMMKAREYQVNESVLDLFLHLRLLSEFSAKASRDNVDGEDGGRKKAKQRKGFRTKRERKALREQKALQKDMEQADALVSHEEQDRMQSDTLKLVFATYFRILKARTPHLMGAVLEGLAKYAHLINQDFFGDILEALKDLIRHSDADPSSSANSGSSMEKEEEEEKEEEDDGNDDDDLQPLPRRRNPTRESLLCTMTAFTLLAGQDAHNARADLHLDLSFFTTRLFQTLLPQSLDADLELCPSAAPSPSPSRNPHPSRDRDGSPPQHRPRPGEDDGDNPKKRVHNAASASAATLLLRSLSATLLPPWNLRSVPPLRLTAFAKQLMTVALHTPERTAHAVLRLLADVAATHGGGGGGGGGRSKIAALWDTEERRGDGTFHATAGSVEASNPFAATVWEGELLRRHYCPRVQEGVGALERALGRWER